jgi:hypothetical protein
LIANKIAEFVHLRYKKKIELKKSVSQYTVEHSKCKRSSP